jgi:hypothetical protein
MGKWRISMKKKLILFLVLMVCQITWAVTYYVDPAIASDANDGSSTTYTGGTTGPIKTIAHCLTHCGEGDTIKLMAGTYPNTLLTLDATWDNLNVTIESYTTTVTIPTNSNYGSIRVSVENAGYLITFKNIIFDLGNIGAADKRFLNFDASVDAKFYFENCTILNGVTYSTHDLISSGTSTAALAREAVFKNCIFSSSGVSNLDIRGFNKFEIDGGTYTFTSESDAGVIPCGSYTVKKIYIHNATINCAGTFYKEADTWVCNEFLFENNIYNQTALTGTRYLAYLIDRPSKIFKIRNNTITCTASASTQAFNVISASLTSTFTNTLLYPEVTGNTIITQQVGWYGNAITLGVNCRGAVIVGNTIKGFVGGITASAHNSIISGNLIVATNPLFLLGLKGTVVTNNTAVANTKTAGTADSGRAIVFSRVPWSLETSNTTTFDSTSVTDSSAWTLTPVTAGMICIVYHTTGASAFTHWGIVQSVAANKVVVDRWRKVTDFSTETPTNNEYARVIQWSEQNYVKNNIFDGSLAANCMNFDFNPQHGWNDIDYNCYRAGTTAFGNLGYGVTGWTAPSSLIAEKALWAAWVAEDNGMAELNDAYSIEADPQFQDTTNYRIGTNSPCYNKGTPTASGGKTSIGVYAPTADGGGYRSRYSNKNLQLKELI